MRAVLIESIDVTFEDALINEEANVYSFLQVDRV